MQKVEFQKLTESDEPNILRSLFDDIPKTNLKTLTRALQSQQLQQRKDAAQKLDEVAEPMPLDEVNEIRGVVAALRKEGKSKRAIRRHVKKHFGIETY